VLLPGGQVGAYLSFNGSTDHVALAGSAVDQLRGEILISIVCFGFLLSTGSWKDQVLVLITRMAT
jgi:hypothetical protein